QPGQDEGNDEDGNDARHLMTNEVEGVVAPVVQDGQQPVPLASRAGQYRRQPMQEKEHVREVFQRASSSLHHLDARTAKRRREWSVASGPWSVVVVGCPSAFGHRLWQSEFGSWQLLVVDLAVVYWQLGLAVAGQNGFVRVTALDCPAAGAHCRGA